MDGRLELGGRDDLAAPAVTPAVKTMTVYPEIPRPVRAARILIAEDHLDSREALSTLLRALGYDVIDAADGRDAVEQARQHRPELILMDMMMPVMDGFEATRMLREDPELSSVRIIAVTAMEGAQEIAHAAGVDDFVRKPIDARALLQTINEWLTQKV